MIKSLLKTLIPTRYHDAAAAADRYLTSFFYLGNRYHCPVCGLSFRTLKPFGRDTEVVREKKIVSMGYRPVSACPRCFSRERARAIAMFLKKNRAFFEQKSRRILHIAPERCLRRLLISFPGVSYLSGDLRPGAAMEVVDVTSLRYADESFDLILCNHVLEHVPDDLKAMVEMRRVLKPGGIALLSVPIALTLEQTYEDPSAVSEEDRLRVFGQEDHCRIYGKDFEHRLRKAGFQVAVHDPLDIFGLEAVRKCALLEEENLYVCT